MNKYYMPVVVVSIRGRRALGSHEASVKTFMKSVLSVWGTNSANICVSYTLPKSINVL